MALGREGHSTLPALGDARPPGSDVRCLIRYTESGPPALPDLAIPGRQPGRPPYGPKRAEFGVMNPELGRVILVIGIVLVIVGGLAVLGVRLPFGRLPGDIAIEGDRGGFYFPIGTMVVISIVLSVLLNVVLRR